MKKSIFMGLSCAALLCFAACTGGNKNQESQETTTETTQVATEAAWAGTYTGVTPCADCPGITVTLVLNADNTYALTSAPQGSDKVFEQAGTIEWAENGTDFTLVSAEGERAMYRLADASVIMLDAEGKVVEGELAASYILNKQ